MWWWNSHCHAWQNPPPQAFRDDSKSGLISRRRVSSTEVKKSYHVFSPVVKKSFFTSPKARLSKRCRIFSLFSTPSGRSLCSPNCRSNIWRPKRLKNDLVIKKTYPLSCHARHANLSNRGSFSRCIVTLGKKKVGYKQDFRIFSRFFYMGSGHPSKNECTRLRFVWWWNSHCHAWQNPPPQAFRDDSKSGLIFP